MGVPAPEKGHVLDFFAPSQLIPHGNLLHAGPVPPSVGGVGRPWAMNDQKSPFQQTPDSSLSHWLGPYWTGFTTRNIAENAKMVKGMAQNKIVQFILPFLGTRENGKFTIYFTTYFTMCKKNQVYN